MIIDPCEMKGLDSELFLCKYRYIKTVGKGSFGEAYLVRSRADGKRYVAKSINTFTMTDKEKRDLQNEIGILAAVNHPNIIRYHEHFEDGPMVFIIMEYADGGDLNSRIKEARHSDSHKPFDPNLAMKWFIQISLALKYLHDHYVLHRDIKTANVFLTTRDEVKLGDFGISTVLQNTIAFTKTVCGTPYYFSPELCENKPYNNKSDVWALGVVFYEMLTLRRPFDAQSLRELVKKILVGHYEPLPPSIPVEIRALCASLLQIRPQDRPSMERILNNDFVHNFLKEYVDSERVRSQKARDEAERTRHKRNKHASQPKTNNSSSSITGDSNTNTNNNNKKDENEKVSRNKATKATSHEPSNEDKSTESEEPQEIPLPTATTISKPRAKAALNEREQMAMLRGMKRDNLRAMLAKQPAVNVQPTEPEEASVKSKANAINTTQGNKNETEDNVMTDDNENDDDPDEFVAQRETIIKQAETILNKTDLTDRPDEFGDKICNSDANANTSCVALPDKTIARMEDLRGILQKKIGESLLNEAMNVISEGMSKEIPNIQIQRKLHEILAPDNTELSNVISKLVMWESQQ